MTLDDRIIHALGELLFKNLILQQQLEEKKEKPKGPKAGVKK